MLTPLLLLSVGDVWLGGHVYDARPAGREG